MEIFFGALNSRKGIQGTFFAGNEPKSVLARDLGDCRENEFKFVERIWTRYFRQNRSRSPEKKEKCSYECTDNSKTDIKDVANRKNPLHGTGGNARRRRSRIDVF